MRKSNSSQPNPVFTTMTPSTTRSAAPSPNVYDRMINDSNRRMLARHHIQHFRQAPKKGSSEVFQRLIQDVNRRQQTKKMIRITRQQEVQTYIQNLKSPKTLSVAQSEATFNRLIKDASNRQQVMKRKLQIKEQEQTLQLASFNSDLKSTKEEETACIERLQKYGERKNKKHQLQRNYKEEMEIRQFQQKREERHPRRAENLERMFRLSTPRHQPAPVKKEQKRLSVGPKKNGTFRRNTPKTARSTAGIQYKFDELDKFLINTVAETPRKVPLPLMVPDLLSTIEAFH